MQTPPLHHNSVNVTVLVYGFSARSLRGVCLCTSLHTTTYVYSSVYSRICALLFVSQTCVCVFAPRHPGASRPLL